MLFLFFSIAIAHPNVCADNADSTACYSATSCFWHPSLNSCTHLDTLTILDPAGCGNQGDLTNCTSSTSCIWNSQSSTCVYLAGYRLQACSEITTEETCWELSGCYFDDRTNVCTSTTGGGPVPPGPPGPGSPVPPNGCSGLIGWQCEANDHCKMTALGCMHEELSCGLARTQQQCIFNELDCFWNTQLSACTSDEFEGYGSAQRIITGTSVCSTRSTSATCIQDLTCRWTGFSCISGYFFEEESERNEELQEQQEETYEEIPELGGLSAAALKSKHVAKSNADVKSKPFPWHLAIGVTLGSFLGTIVVLSCGLRIKICNKRSTNENEQYASMTA